MKFQKSIRTIINVCKLEPFLASLSVFLIMVASILELLGVGLILPIVNLNQNPVDDPSLLESILLGFFDLISLDPIIEYLLIMIVVLFILKSCLVYFVQRHIAFAVVRFGALRRIEFVEAITNSSWAYFSRNSVGSLINTLGQEAQTTQRCVSSVFNFLARIFQLPIYIIGAAMIDVIPAFTGMVAGIIIFLVFSTLLSGIREMSTKARNAIDQMSKFLGDVVAGLKPIKSMSKHHLVVPLITNEVLAYEKSFRRYINYQTISSSFKEPIFLLFMIPFLYFSLVVNNNPIDEIFVILFIFYRLLVNIAQAQDLYQGVASTEIYFNSMLSKINDSRSYKEADDVGKTIKNFSTIKINDLHLNLSNKKIIDGLSCQFNKGEITTIDGISGSGKTTLTDLLVGLYKPSQGSILIDGVNLSDISMKSWRQMIGYVPQENFLLHDSIKINITLNDSDINDEQVLDSLKLSGAMEFCQDLEKGIYTDVGERGNRFSGGQKQRIMLARALVRLPKLLILDEPTSGLDPLTEKEICSALVKLKKSMAIVLVSHQSGAKEISDKIYTIKNGQIQ